MCGRLALCVAPSLTDRKAGGTATRQIWVCAAPLSPAPYPLIDSSPLIKPRASASRSYFSTHRCVRCTVPSLWVESSRHGTLATPGVKSGVMPSTPRCTLDPATFTYLHPRGHSFRIVPRALWFFTRLYHQWHPSLHPPCSTFAFKCDKSEGRRPVQY